MSENTFVEQEYWDKSYKELALFKADKNDPLVKFFDEHLHPEDIKGKSVFEIGCFPGRYLVHFGDSGCTLSGLDLTPRITTDLPSWLTRLGYKAGDFYCEDIYKFSTDKKYDIVCSFGFIEHFEDWDKIIEKHHELVNDKGLIVITTPNFNGFVQKMLHSYLDKENLARHNLRSMKPGKWKTVLEKLGYEVSFCGSFGGFDFWVDNEERNATQLKVLEFMNTKATPYLKQKVRTNRYAYSPYLGIIARKK